MTDQPTGYDVLCDAANAVAKIDLLDEAGTSYCTAFEVMAMGRVLHALGVLPQVPCRAEVNGDRLDVHIRDVAAIFPDPGGDPLAQLPSYGRLAAALEASNGCVQALQDLVMFADHVTHQFIADQRAGSDDPVYTLPQVGMVRGDIWANARAALEDFGQDERTER